MTVERCSGTVANAEDIGVVFRRLCDLGKGRLAVVTGELEDIGRVLNNVDVDVASLKRVDTGSSVDGVVVLEDLNNIVVGASSGVSVTTQVIHVKPVGLATLAGDDTNALDISASKLAGKKLKRRGSQILIGTIESLLLPGHEKVNQVK